MPPLGSRSPRYSKSEVGGAVSPPSSSRHTASNGVRPVGPALKRERDLLPCGAAPLGISAAREGVRAARRRPLLQAARPQQRGVDQIGGRLGSREHHHVAQRLDAAETVQEALAKRNPRDRDAGTWVVSKLWPAYRGARESEWIVRTGNTRTLRERESAASRAAGQTVRVTPVSEHKPIWSHAFARGAPCHAVAQTAAGSGQRDGTQQHVFRGRAGRHEER